MYVGGPQSPLFFFLIGRKILLYLQRHEFCSAKSNIEIQLQFFYCFFAYIVLLYHARSSPTNFYVIEMCIGCWGTPLSSTCRSPTAQGQ